MGDKDTTAKDSKTSDSPKGGKGKKAEGPVLMFNRRGGPYTCSHHAPLKGREAGTGVSAMKTVKTVVLPGANLIDRDKYDLVKDNNGFKGRVARREIVISDKAWADLPNGLCIEEAKKSANLPTLADLLEAETRDDVAQVIEATLEVATRTVRKEKKHLTAIQVARLGRQR